MLGATLIRLSEDFASISSPSQTNRRTSSAFDHNPKQQTVTNGKIYRLGASRSTPFYFFDISERKQVSLSMTNCVCVCILHTLERNIKDSANRRTKPEKKPHHHHLHLQPASISYLSNPNRKTTQPHNPTVKEKCHLNYGCFLRGPSGMALACLSPTTKRRRRRRCRLGQSSGY